MLAHEFQDTQGGTLHFRYLLAENGGFLRVAQSLAEHAQQIAETLQSPEIGRAACARFVERSFGRTAGTWRPRRSWSTRSSGWRVESARAADACRVCLYPLQWLL